MKEYKISDGERCSFTWCLCSAVTIRSWSFVSNKANKKSWREISHVTKTILNVHGETSWWVNVRRLSILKRHTFPRDYNRRLLSYNNAFTLNSISIVSISSQKNPQNFMSWIPQENFSSRSCSMLTWVHCILSADCPFPFIAASVVIKTLWLHFWRRAVTSSILIYSLGFFCCTFMLPISCSTTSQRFYWIHIYWMRRPLKFVVHHKGIHPIEICNWTLKDGVSCIVENAEARFEGGKMFRMKNFNV